MLTAAASSALLGGAPTYVGLASAFPPDLNELAGGAYGRVPLAWGAVASGAITAAAFSVNVPAGATAAWLTMHSAASGGVFMGAVPIGGAERACAVVGNRLVVSGASSFAAGDAVVVLGAPPVPLAEGVTYYVRDVTAAGIALASTQGGSAIAFTAPGGPSCVISAAPVATVFAGAGRIDFSGLTLAMAGGVAAVPTFAWTVADYTPVDAVQGLATRVELARNVPAGYQIPTTPSLPQGVAINVDAQGTATLAIAPDAPAVTTGPIVLGDPEPAVSTGPLPSFQAVPESSGVNVPFVAGLVLDDAGAAVELGTDLPNTQVVPLSRYASGAPHHVAIAGRLESATQDVPVTVQLQAGTTAGAAVTLAALTTNVKQSVSITLTGVALATADVTLADYSGTYIRPAVENQPITAGGVAVLSSSQTSAVPVSQGILIPNNGSTYYAWLNGTPYRGSTSYTPGPYRIQQGADAAHVVFSDGVPLSDIWSSPGSARYGFRTFTEGIADPPARTLADATLDAVLWSGPEACVARFWDSTPFTGTKIRIEWYVRVHADGQIEVTPILHNGALDEAAAKATQYTATLTIGGQVRVVAKEAHDIYGPASTVGVMHYPYERVHMDSHYVAASTPTVRLVHDRAHWMATGVVPPISNAYLETPTLRAATNGYTPGMSWMTTEASQIVGSGPGIFAELVPNTGGIRRGWNWITMEELHHLYAGTQTTWRMMLAANKGYRPFPSTFRLAATGKRPDLSAAPWSATGFGVFAQEPGSQPPCGQPSYYRIGFYSAYTNPVDFHHATNPGVFAYLCTARPDLADPMLDMATAGMLSINSAARNGAQCEVRVRASQSDMYMERATGWAMRNLAACVLATRDGTADKTLWSAIFRRNIDIRAAEGLSSSLGIPPMLHAPGPVQTLWSPYLADGSATNPTWLAQYPNKQPWIIPWQASFGAASFGWILAQSYLVEQGGATNTTLVGNAYLDLVVNCWGDGVTSPHYLSTYNYGAIMVGPDSATGNAMGNNFTRLNSLDATWAQVATRNAVWYPRKANLQGDAYGRNRYTQAYGWPAIVYAAKHGRPGAAAALARAQADSAYVAWRTERKTDMSAFNVYDHA